MIVITIVKKKDCSVPSPLVPNAPHEILQRIRPQEHPIRGVRREMETFAARERRTLGNLGEVLIEWSLEKLKAAGSTERLLNAAVPILRRRRDDASITPQTPTIANAELVKREHGESAVIKTYIKPK